MLEYDVHVGDWGTELRFWLKDAETGVIPDISTATSLNIFIKKPVSPYTVLTKTGVFITDGSDGGMKYTLISTDIDTDGPWEIQAQAITPTGQWSSTVVVLNVAPNLA